MNGGTDATGERDGTDAGAEAGETVLVVNPNSGSADHLGTVEDRAALLGYEVRISDHEGHAIELASEAASAGADRVVAVGGDGTLNEVIRGLLDAEALDSVTLGVLPAGTGNDFATNIGIPTIEDGFHALEEDIARRIDLGMADDRPFLNSCVAGLTATASQETDPDSKSRYGVLAYVLTTLEVATEFQGLDLRLWESPDETGDPDWTGPAEVVLVGNGRRFSARGSEQANLEDGKLEVTVVEEAGSVELVEEHVFERFLDAEAEHITRMRAASLTIDLADRETAPFSLDGEMIESGSITLRTLPQALSMVVGGGYEPDPDG